MYRPKRPFIIDVEASGFGSTSYPIEIGVVLADGWRYCSLVVPIAEWTHWDDGAQKVHGISRDMLITHGKPVHEVADELNEVLSGKTLYSDAWVVDKPWLTTLFHAAHRPMEFSVSPLELILSEPQMAVWYETRDALLAETELQRHRASNDAWIIQETYRRTLQAS
jgi:hypothetical protein